MESGEWGVESEEAAGSGEWRVEMEKGKGAKIKKVGN